MKKLLSLLLVFVMVSSAMGANIFASYDDVAYVVLENTTFPEGVWTGIRRYEVTLTNNEMTMADVLSAAFDENGITCVGIEENYISEIDGLAAFDGGYESGWMVTLNDWFISAGIGEFYISDGDVIAIRYTQNGFGADIGGTWENNNKTLNGVSFSEGELSEEFSPEKFEYTLLLSQETESITVEPVATNKNFQTRIYRNTQIAEGENGWFIEGEEAFENSISGLAVWEELPENINYYKRTQDIPVKDGDVILVACGLCYWNSMNNGEYGSGAENVDGCVYRFTVQKPDADEINVDIGVYDYTAGTYKEQNSSEAVCASENGIVFEIKDFTVEKGTTAMDAFKKAFESVNKSYTLNNQYNYISAVGELGEYSCGEQSGWMYSVNDEFKLLGASEYVLDDGDFLKLHYSVKGWGEDIGNYFESTPIIKNLTLAGTVTDVENNPIVTGEGSAQSPFVVPVTVSADTDITSLVMRIDSSLHPKYLSVATEEGLSNVLSVVNYENDVTFAIETLDKSLKTYYRVKVTKQSYGSLDDGEGEEFETSYTPSGGGGGTQKKEVQKQFNIEDIAKYILKTTPNPCVGSIGGEWAVLGLARSGEEVPQEFYQRYYENVKSYVKECKGILHDKKYTEYSRVILALTAIGKNPADVAGYNLLIPLADYEKTMWQGINGPIWALIALDSGNYEIPQNTDAKIQATRKMYVDYILNAQKSDGGWSLLKESSVSDADVTAMAIQALSKYTEDEKVDKAVKKALSMLKNTAPSTSESLAQILTALCELGKKYDNAKLRENVTKDLLSFYTDGGFSHTDGSAVNQMSTEQAFYSLVALKRFLNGEPSLYTMRDVLNIKEQETDKITELKTFEDVKEHKNKTAIEALAARGIINGKSENIFEPESTMTRAEFATIIVRALSLTSNEKTAFTDVTESDWFYIYVNAAYENEIVNGVSESLFNPYAPITRQEAAVMLSRSAKKAGIYKDFDALTARNILAEFSDYVKTAQWAVNPLAFCVDEGIIESDEMEIFPNEAVRRGEIAQSVYNLLERANMI